MAPRGASRAAGAVPGQLLSHAMGPLPKSGSAVKRGVPLPQPPPRGVDSAPQTPAGYGDGGRGGCGFGIDGRDDSGGGGGTDGGTAGAGGDCPEAEPHYAAPSHRVEQLLRHLGAGGAYSPGGGGGGHDSLALCGSAGGAHSRAGNAGGGSCAAGALAPLFSALPSALNAAAPLATSSALGIATASEQRERIRRSIAFGRSPFPDDGGCLLYTSPSPRD